MLFVGRRFEMHECLLFRVAGSSRRTLAVDQAWCVPAVPVPRSIQETFSTELQPTCRKLGLPVIAWHSF